MVINQMKKKVRSQGCDPKELLVFEGVDLQGWITRDEKLLKSIMFLSRTD